MPTSTDINTLLIEEVLKVQLEAEQVMLEKVAKRVKRGISTVGWNETKLEDTMQLRKEIESILNDTEKLTNTKVNDSLLKAYTISKDKYFL